jgi:outer membrane usher protein
VALAVPPPANGQGTQRAILGLTVNLVERGELFVVLRAGDVFVKVRDLEAAGLRGFAGRTEAIDGELYVSLRSLAPDVRFEVDEVSLTLRLSVAPSQLAPTSLDFGAGRPPGLQYAADPSAFLNYAFSVIDVDRYTASVEGGVSAMGAVLTSTAFRTEDGALVRGLSSLTVWTTARDSGAGSSAITS